MNIYEELLSQAAAWRKQYEEWYQPDAKLDQWKASWSNQNQTWFGEDGRIMQYLTAWYAQNSEWFSSGGSSGMWSDFRTSWDEFVQRWSSQDTTWYGSGGNDSASWPSFRTSWNEFRDLWSRQDELWYGTTGNGDSFWTQFMDSWVQWNGETENANWKRYFDLWKYYVYDHEVYNKAYSAADYTRIKSEAEAEKGDAVYALAEALTATTTSLKDPQVQTNALLSQILIVATAIMEQTNNDGASFVDAISALALGIQT